MFLTFITVRHIKVSPKEHYKELDKEHYKELDKDHCKDDIPLEKVNRFKYNL